MSIMLIEFHYYFLKIYVLQDQSYHPIPATVQCFPSVSVVARNFNFVPLRHTFPSLQLTALLKNLAFYQGYVGLREIVEFLKSVNNFVAISFVTDDITVYITFYSHIS